MSDGTSDSQRLKDEQRRDWDAAASGWKKWWPLFERSAQHVSDRLVDLAEVRTGSRVLDIATGNGEPALTAARRAGASGRVIATDQSPGMLAIARERAAAAGITNVEFHLTDGEALTIGETGFDAIVCRWGLMFMPDVAGALRGMYTRLRVGGRLAFAVWATADRVPLIGIGAQSVRRIAGLPDPPPDALGPVRLADETRVRTALTESGFKDITMERIPVAFEFDSAAELIQFRCDISAQFRMLVDGQSADVRARIIESITEEVRPYVNADGRVRTVNESICYAASS